MSIFDDESMCNRCGACCVTKSGSPCEHLEYVGSMQYKCSIYENRLGWHRTLNGIAHECVTIEREITDGGGPDICAYKKAYRENMQC